MTDTTAAQKPLRGPFKPTPGQIKAAEHLFVAMAHEQLVRPVVEAYETAILAKHQFHIAAQWVREGDADRVILDRKLSYLLDDADAAVFYSECHQARDAAGLKVDNPEHCPLCVAENLRIQAENALLEAISEIPGLEAFSQRTHAFTLENRARALDLSMRLLAPFVAKGPDILRRIVQS